MDLSIEEFNTIGERTPLLANLKPHGKVYLKTVLCSCLLLVFIVYSITCQIYTGWVDCRYVPCISCRDMFN